MAPTLPFLLFSIFFLNRGFAVDIEVILSSNATTVKLGQSIELRCELKNYNPNNELYYVTFFQENSYFCYYEISGPDSSGKRAIRFYNQTSTLPSLGRHPFSSTFPIYESTVTPTIASTNEYWCRLEPGSSAYVNSKHLSITVTPLTSAVFTSNVTAIVPKKPFTATCTFANFNLLPVNYVVTFSSTRDGQLAFIEVVNGTALQSDGLSDKVAVSAGTHSTFPTFDLELTEKIDASSSYWCALEETGKMPVVSEAWPVFVKFTSSKPAGNQRLGSCTVGANMNVTGKEYTVQFFSNLGPIEHNFLAEYAFKPNHTDEFKFNHLAPWTLLRHGPITSWPTFTILANGTALSGHWWCVLTVGSKGTLDYPEFRSNSADL